MVDITQEQGVYGRVVFKMNFHEEIVILTFIESEDKRACMTAVKLMGFW